MDSNWIALWFRRQKRPHSFWTKFGKSGHSDTLLLLHTMCLHAAAAILRCSPDVWQCRCCHREISVAWFHEFSILNFEFSQFVCFSKNKAEIVYELSHSYKLEKVNHNWHEGGHFPTLVLLGSDFVSWIFIKNFQTFLEVKIDINQVNLTPCQAHWVL